MRKLSEERLALDCEGTAYVAFINGDGDEWWIPVALIQRYAIPREDLPMPATFYYSEPHKEAELPAIIPTFENGIERCWMRWTIESEWVQCKRKRSHLAFNSSMLNRTEPITEAIARAVGCTIDDYWVGA